jgi:outer membrane protein assembly factor BamB
VTTLWLLLGLILGGAFLAFARAQRGAERRVLALGLLVAAAIYVGFALIGAGPVWLLVEALGVAAYGVLAWLGLRRSPFWLAVGWALHPAWDVCLHLVGAGAAFAPEWYAIACISFDLLVAAYITAQFKRMPVIRWLAVLVLAVGIVGCTGPVPDGGTRMFRLDAQRSGVYPPTSETESGMVAWTFATGGSVRSSPVVAGDLLLVGSGDGFLYAFDKESGAERWRFEAGSPVNSSPAVHGDAAYIGDRGNRFYAVDLRNGSLRWRAETGADVPWPWGHEGWDYFTSSPAVAGDLVIAGSGDGNVYAFDARSGTERWRASTGGRVRASPSVGDSSVYVGSTDGVFYGLDLATGAVRWTYETEGVAHDAATSGFDRTSIQSTAAVDDAHVFFGSRDGGVYALERSTGALAWRTGHETSWIVGSPGLADPGVCVGGSDGQFFECLDRETGEPIWQIPTGARVFSSPAVAGDVMFVGSHAGALDAIEVASGTRRWSLPLGAEVLSSPELADGMLYVGTDGGAVHAIHLSDAPAPLRSVYWDEARAPWNLSPNHEVVRDHFAARGYAVTTRAELLAFMEARIEDRVPSVVVFAMDDFPHEAGVPPSDTILGRRYLDAGGKVVWIGFPPLVITHDVEGQPVAIDRDAATVVLGVDFAGWHVDRYPVYPTDAGRRWGLTTWWMGGSGIAADQVTEVLATSENGEAGSWVKSYGGPPGTGFVWLWGGDGPVDPTHLQEAFHVAELGIGVKP